MRLYSRINISFFFFKLIPGAHPFTKGKGTSYKVDLVDLLLIIVLEINCDLSIRLLRVTCATECRFGVTVWKSMAC